MKLLKLIWEDIKLAFPVITPAFISIAVLAVCMLLFTPQYGAIIGLILHFVYYYFYIKVIIPKKKASNKNK